MATDSQPDMQTGRRRQIYVLGAAFVTITVLLLVGYLLFLRPQYVPLFTSLRPEDAAAITDALSKQGIDYQLADEGQTVMVPSDRADAARIHLAGSVAAAKGAVGFELFNKSDMGLTSFAQKINYQRALQGELERTIMMEEGIEQARVHLALPERGLFQRERLQPKAAVTLTTRPGVTMDPVRVAGIQALVAASVPDLPASDVVVLDGMGHVVSVNAPPQAQVLTPDMQARQGLGEYYAAQIRGIIDQQMPGMTYQVSAFVQPKDGAADAAGFSETVTKDDIGTARKVRLRIVIQTPAALSPQDQSQLTQVISDALGLDLASGDELGFAVGLSRPAAPVQSGIASSAPAPVPQAIPPVIQPGTSSHWAVWIIGALIFAFAALGGLILQQRWRQTLLNSEDHARFAERLRQLLDNEASHGAAE